MYAIVKHKVKASWATFHWLRHSQGFPVNVQLVKNLPAKQETLFNPRGRSTGEGIGYPLWYFGASLVAQLVKNPPVILWCEPRETWVRPLGWKIPWRRKQLPTPVFWPGEFLVLSSPWGRRVRHDWATFTSLSRHSSHIHNLLNDTSISSSKMVVKKQISTEHQLYGYAK